MKVSESTLVEIFKLQNKLNCLIGRDTLNDKNKNDWLFDYTFALHDEITELLNCIDWKWWSKTVKENPEKQYKVFINKENAKIEIIDIIHFYVSICLITDVMPRELCYYINRFDQTYVEHEKFNKTFDNGIKLLTQCNLILNNAYISLSKPNLTIVEIALKQMLLTILDICESLDISEKDILRIYKMKHEKNVKRQHDGYDVRTKTESDNQEIIAQI